MKRQNSIHIHWTLVAAFLCALLGIVLFFIFHTFGILSHASFALSIIFFSLHVILFANKYSSLFIHHTSSLDIKFRIQLCFLFIIFLVINIYFINHPYRLDLTHDKRNSLNDNSINTLSSLIENGSLFIPQPVSSITDNEYNLLLSFEYYSKGKLKVVFFNPDKPSFSSPFVADLKPGQLIINVGNRSEVIHSIDERSITSSLQRLTYAGPNTIYFTTGHGEFPPVGTGPETYTMFTKLLKNKGYIVNTINLQYTQKIPADAIAVIIAGPKIDFTEKESKIIQEYLSNNGSLILMQEPRLISSHTQYSPMMMYINENWGIRVQNNIIVNPDMNLEPFVTVADVESYANHIIMQDIQDDLVVFPTARSVEIISPPKNVSLVPLLSTSPNAWAESNIGSVQERSEVYDVDDDIPGPIPMGIAATNIQTNSKIIIFGDSEFSLDANFSKFANGKFFENSLTWIMSREKVDEFPIKLLFNPKIQSLSRVELGYILLAFVALPCIFTIIGIYVGFRFGKNYE